MLREKQSIPSNHRARKDLESKGHCTGERKLHDIKTEERKTHTGNCTNNKKLKITLCLKVV